MGELIRAGQSACTNSSRSGTQRLQGLGRLRSRGLGLLQGEKHPPRGGGAVALAAAARRPAAVCSLTLIEPAMQALAVGRGAVLRFILGILFTRLTSLTPETYARRFLRLMHIPEEMRGGADREELKRMAAGLSALRVPQKDALLRELDSLRAARIPLLVVSGGWSDAVEVTADVVAERGAGRYLRRDLHAPITGMMPILKRHNATKATIPTSAANHSNDP